MAANRDGVWNTAGGHLPFASCPAVLPHLVVHRLALGVAAAAARVRDPRPGARLERAQRAQEAFSRRLIESQEGERKRIAAELHDSLSQTLVVIKNRAMLSLRSPDDHEAREQLGRNRRGRDRTRSTRSGRSPTTCARIHLDRLGLTKALEAMIDKVSGANGQQFERDSTRSTACSRRPRDQRLSHRPGRRQQHRQARRGVPGAASPSRSCSAPSSSPFATMAAASRPASSAARARRIRPASAWRSARASSAASRRHVGAGAGDRPSTVTLPDRRRIDAA